MNGTVDWYDEAKRFGFIVPSDGSRDVFVHLNALQDAGIKSLKSGDKVSFDVEEGNRGPVAVNLRMDEQK